MSLSYVAKHSLMGLLEHSPSGQGKKPLTEPAPGFWLWFLGAQTFWKGCPVLVFFRAECRYCIWGSGGGKPLGVLFSYSLEITMPGEAKGWAGGGVGSENSSLPFLGALTYG